jgi:hypothetical protein
VLILSLIAALELIIKMYSPFNKHKPPATLIESSSCIMASWRIFTPNLSIPQAGL